MFWTIVGALLFVFVVLPVLAAIFIALITSKTFWKLLGVTIIIIGSLIWLLSKGETFENASIKISLFIVFILIAWLIGTHERKHPVSSSKEWNN